MRVVGMLAGVITQQPMGARDSQTGSDDITLLPPGCGFLTGLRERCYYHYKSAALFISSSSRSYYFTWWRLKQRGSNISHNPPSTVITSLLNPGECYIFNSSFWVDLGKINILDEVRSGEKWFPSGWSSRLEEGVLLVDYPSQSERCVGKRGTGEPFSWIQGRGPYSGNKLIP